MSIRKRLAALERHSDTRDCLQFLFLDVPGYGGAVACVDCQLIPCPDVDALTAAHHRDPYSIVTGVYPWTLCGEQRPEWAGPWIPALPSHEH